MSLCGFEPQLTNLEFIVYPPKLKKGELKSSACMSLDKIILDLFGPRPFYQPTSWACLGVSSIV